VDEFARAAAARRAAQDGRRALRATVTATRTLIRNRLATGDLAVHALDLHGAPTVAATLDRVVEVAPRAVPGCAYASVTREGRRGWETPAASGEPARALDALQYSAGTGPCLRVLAGESPVLDTELPARAAVPGVRTVLSCRLGDSSLNLYGTAGPASVRTAQAYAAHAQRALDAAAERELLDQLRAAVASNRVIGTAIGILMALRKVSEAEAFDILRRASQHTNRKLRDIAEEVVRMGTV
jgi:hypothetical protein